MAKVTVHNEPRYILELSEIEALRVRASLDYYFHSRPTEQNSDYMRNIKGISLLLPLTSCKPNTEATT